MPMHRAELRSRSYRLTNLAKPSWGLAAVFIAMQLAAAGVIYAVHEAWANGLPAEKNAAWRPGHGNGIAPGPMDTQSNTAMDPLCSNCTVRLDNSQMDLFKEQMTSAMAALLRTTEPCLAAHGAESTIAGGAASGHSFPVLANTGVMADEPYGPNPQTNIPGVEDIHQELQKYFDTMLAAMTSDGATAIDRQHRPLAEERGIDVVDNLEDVESIPERIEFLNELCREAEARERVRVAIVSTVAADVIGLRKELVPWMQYHTELGVQRFYLLYDGVDSDAVAILQKVRCVELMHINSTWATAADTATLNAYNRVTLQWAGQAGNYQLMFKQGYGLQEALRRSKEADFHWLMHLDPDELFYPGGPSSKITAELDKQPDHIPAVRFMNMEAQVEVGNVRNRYEQVTLFRSHKHFITPEAFRYRSQYKLGANGAFLSLYANGKSAVRVDAPGVKQSGPHFFTGDSSPRWKSPSNPGGLWQNAVSDSAVVLHYAYTHWSDVSAKAHRSCPDEYLAAARAGDRQTIKSKCFVIDYDADAYIASSQGQKATMDFFYSRQVLSEAVSVECRDPATGKSGWCPLHDIPRLLYLLEKIGLMKRIYMPQVLLRGHERVIQRQLHRASSLLEKNGLTSSE